MDRFGPVLAKGPVVDTLLEVADLIVMASDGREGLFDAFRGSVTEGVVREASFPVLVVPTPTDLRWVRR